MLGESGAGKSTLARSLLQMPAPRSGSVLLDGQDLTRLKGRRLAERRRHMQIVFQDPFRSLDPRWRVCDIVEEPLIGYRWGTRAERRRRVSEVLDRVGLPLGTFGHRRPRELSGGQCQRVAIARALVLRPSIVICDEAVSSLDVVLQRQILRLLADLRMELDLSYLFISHDLWAVEQIGDRVAVLYRGRLCEIGPQSAVYRRPAHPYTAKLLAQRAWSARTAMPASAPDVRRDVGASNACPFYDRCGRADERCGREQPELVPLDAHHAVACHYPSEALRAYAHSQPREVLVGTAGFVDADA